MGRLPHSPPFPLFALEMVGGSVGALSRAEGKELPFPMPLSEAAPSRAMGSPFPSGLGAAKALTLHPANPPAHQKQSCSHPPHHVPPPSHPIFLPGSSVRPCASALLQSNSTK